MENRFKSKTDFEKNIILRDLVRKLKKTILEKVNLIEGLVKDINILKNKIKSYGNDINKLNTIISSQRIEIKRLKQQNKKINTEIYQLIIKQNLKNDKE